MVMKIYKNAKLSKKHRNSVLAVGNFDGLHLGHQKVINEAKQKAKKNKLPFGLMTFEPIPMMFFKKINRDHRINSLDQKKIQLKKLKLDFLIIIKFNKNFSTLTAEEFIKEIIFNKTRCRYLYVSKNFKFGFERQGNIQTLKKFEKKFNFVSIITKPFKKNYKTISSTLIRKKIREGKISLVNKLLNRYWCIEGKVIKGKKRGRRIGFPTCNLSLNSYVVPKLGVYAVRVKGKTFNKNGIANVGYRPTFNGQSLLLETNIFGFNQNLYNKVINVSFKKFIRVEKKFKNLEYLKKQIKIDTKLAKK
jgi:riboflavin kinase/FMN adenylyltransferase